MITWKVLEYFMNLTNRWSSRKNLFISINRITFTKNETSCIMVYIEFCLLLKIQIKLSSKASKKTYATFAAKKTY